MKITEIKIRKVFNDKNRMKAIVSITIDNVLAIHEIKVIQGDKGLFVGMPSKYANGVFRDIIHPINTKIRKYLEQEIINAYISKLNEHEVEGE